MNFFRTLRRHRPTHHRSERRRGIRATLEPLETRRVPALIVPLTRNGFAGIAEGVGAQDDGFAPFNAIQNPIAEVATQTPDAMVQASVEAATTSGGTAAELLTRTRVAGPAGSQVRASVGTSDSKYLPPTGSWIGYEVRAQGNERRGDRVRIELRYSWEVKFHDVNENQQSVLIEIDGSPRGKVFNLAWESFTQQAGNAMDRSGSGTSYFDTRVGERFDLSAVSTLTTLAAGPTGEADLTELRLTYSLTARYLGPLGPPVRITSVRPLNDARGTYGVRISFNGQVLNGIYDIGSGEFASVKLISKGAPTIRIRSVSLDLATLRQATILFDRPIPANRKVTLVIEGSRIYAEGLLTRSIDARGNGVEGSQYRGVIQGRRIRQV